MAAEIAAASATLEVPTFWATTLEGWGTGIWDKISGEIAIRGKFHWAARVTNPGSWALRSRVAKPAIASCCKL